jgi:DNA-binding CsgD family transcriptional regulator
MKYLLYSEDSLAVILPAAVFSVLSEISQEKTVGEIARSRDSAISTVRVLAHKGYVALGIMHWHGKDRIRILRQLLTKAKQIPDKPPVSLEPSVDRDALLQENALARRIQDIRYAGHAPWCQYDVLDSNAVLCELKVENPSIKNRHILYTLRSLGLRPIGRYSIFGIYRYLWTSLPPQPRENIIALVKHRVETNAVELHRELVMDYIAPSSFTPAQPALTPLERDIVNLRLQGHPPRRIASMLSLGHKAVVYAVSNEISKKLGVKMKDCAALKESVESLGVFPSRDPADY